MKIFFFKTSLDFYISLHPWRVTFVYFLQGLS